MFGKSLAPTRPIRRGEVLTRDMLAAKKPGGGISPDEIAKVLGRKVEHEVQPDRLLRWEDLE